MSNDRRLLTSNDGTPQSSVVSDPRQRRILSILREKTEPVGVDELAAALMTQEDESEPERLRIDLRHRCLPKLEEIGWVEWDATNRVTAESLPFGDETTPLPELQELDDQSWAAVGTVLTSPRRQELLATIVDRSHQLTVDELTTELASRSNTPWGQYDDAAAIHVLLHHIDLPKLADVGLIEYHTDEQWLTRTRQLMRLADLIDFERSLIES